jgi:hypothetical protein
LLGTCWNVTAAIFCTPHCCKLGPVCSNAPCSLSTLKLFDTLRVGLCVFTTTFLNVGDVLGEYAGKLCAYDAMVEVQPEQACKQNSGYTMLPHTKSTSMKFVYIEALECGFTRRYTIHSCQRCFRGDGERHGGESAAVMISDVTARTELTVNYGDEIWFKCACDECGFKY